ncbi:hypothetical protein Pfo_007224 [Paulownia fortunei]|nr:hypothetical protein Pfo_007224 [Paulownia fortunei]
MASMIRTLSVTLFFAFLLFAQPTFSADSPESSPSPSPLLPPEDVSPPPATPSPSPALINSPPAPPPSDLAPNSPSPAPYPGKTTLSTKNVSHEDQSNAGDLEAKDNSSGGMSGGKKAGVAIGVIAAASIVGVGALVYKKRQQNIRRSQYGNAARREIL